MIVLKSLKKISILAIAVLITLILCSCISDIGILSQSNIDEANKKCNIRLEKDRQESNRFWFTNWIQCKTELVMPFEIMIKPNKEKEIREMYKTLYILGTRVDSGLVPVEDVYKEWDKMKLEIGLRACLLRITNADGSSECQM